MSAVESVTQSVRPETGVSEDDLVIMDYSDKEAADTAGAEEACTQTVRCHGRRGRCGRRKMMRRNLGDFQSDDESGGFRCEKRRLKKKAMKWMRKMMMRRMMMRMCYGPPRFGLGFGCRRRRMISAMMDSLDTTSTSDDSRSEAEDCCGRRRRCGRRMRPRRNENVKEAANADKQPEETGTQTKFPEKEVSAIQVATEKSASAPTDGTVEKDKGEMTQRKVCFREAPRHGRCMGRRRRHHHHHHHQSSSGSSSSSDSSSNSSSSSSEDDDVHREKDRRCRRRRDGGAQGRDQAVGGEETKTGKKCGKGDRKAYKGKKFHKKVMKGVYKGYYRRFC